MPASQTEHSSNAGRGSPRPAARELRAAAGWGSVVAPVASSGVSDRPQRYTELAVHHGLAVLAVIVFNVYQFCNVNHTLYRGSSAYPVLNALDAGVPWLFVLTAFLLFEPIARAAVDGSVPPTARTLLCARAFRLMPVYYVAILVVWFSRQPSLPGDWRDLLEHLTFTQVFDPKRIYYTNGPAWAVCVLVFFCVILAALTATLPRICQRLPSRRARIILMAASTAVLGASALMMKVVAFGVEHRRPNGSPTTWFGPLANLDNFAIGMSLAIVAATLNSVRIRRRDRAGLRLVGLLVLAGAITTRGTDGWSSVFFTTECSLGFAALIAAVVLGDQSGQPRSAPAIRPLIGLGIIWYSTYLWHEPILLALSSAHGLVRQTPTAFPSDLVAVVTLSILGGWLSYLVIERPTRALATFLRRDSRRPPTVYSARGPVRVAGCPSKESAE